MHCCNKGDASLFVMVSFSTFYFKWKWMDVLTQVKHRIGSNFAMLEVSFVVVKYRYH